MDGISTCGPKEEVTLRVVVRMPPQHIIKGVRGFREGQCRSSMIQIATHLYSCKSNVCLVETVLAF